MSSSKNKDPRLKMDEDMKRLDEEFRRSRERSQEIADRRSRKMKQIRAQQEKDRAAWLKRMEPVLDKELSGMFGKLYFYDFTQEQVAGAIRRSGLQITGSGLPESESSK